MKTVTRATALLVLCSSLVAKADLTNGLVAYYPFNGNANDQSGQGRNGTNNGAVLTTDRFSNSGQAFWFNATNADIEVAEGPDFETNGLTVSLWVNPESLSDRFGSFVDLVGKDGFNSAPRQWVLQIKPSGQIRAAVFTSLGEADYDSSAIIRTGAWTHVIQTWNGTNVSVYIGGAFDGSLSAGGTLLPGDAPVRIGGSPLSQHYLLGRLDDVRIYNRALSDLEVAGLFSTETPPASAVVTRSPTSQAAQIGEAISVQAIASGSLPLQYTWFRDGIAVQGATNSSLSFQHISPAACGLYTVTISNQYGSVMSKPARVGILGSLTAWGENNYGQINVPANLTNIVQVACGNFHVVALNDHGTVTCWGRNDFGQCSPPPNLSNVVHVAAGHLHSLALKADGTVVQWGLTFWGLGGLPLDLTNAIWVDAGADHSIALTAEHKLVAWGGERSGDNTGTVPPGLPDVCSVSANSSHNNLALFSSGTPFAWGDDLDPGFTVARQIPEDATNVVAVSTRDFHALAVAVPGTVLAWGSNDMGQCDVPSGLTNAIAVAAGGSHCLALTSSGQLIGWGSTNFGLQAIPIASLPATTISAGINFNAATYAPFASPSIAQNPASETILVGSNALFSVSASGATPLHYQWRLNGFPMSEETNSLLALFNVQLSNCANYSVVISNDYGCITSTPAKLRVVTNTFEIGLVAYYPFNGDANDESGNGNNGTVYGATLTTNRFGNTNSAYQFNGTSAYITTPLTNTIFNGDFTASVWFNISDLAHGWPTLLDEQNGGFRLQLPGDDCGCSEPERLVSYSAATAGGGQNWLLFPAQTTSVNKFQQVVVAKAGINVRMFVNGQVAATNQVANSTSQAGAYLSIGAQFDLTSFTFLPGVLDDVRIYNRALSSQEIKQLYDFEWPDSDHDGLSDYDEINVYHTDPNKKDTDGDGLSDYQEVMVYQTDPLKADTDGDGFNDGAEVYAGHDPLSANDFPAANLSIFTAIELEFVSKTNTSYVIQASPDLITWTNYEGPILGDGNVWKKTYSTRGSQNLHFRVELAP